LPHLRVSPAAVRIAAPPPVLAGKAAFDIPSQMLII
jgi:hypothetical protein